MFVIGEALDFESFDNERREGHVALEKDGHAILVRNSFVHQRVIADEIQDRVRQSLSVVDTLTRPRFGHLRRQDGQPSRAGRRLFFELAQKGRVHIGRGEDANGRARQSILARREDGVKTRVVARHLVNALCQNGQKTKKKQNKTK